MVDSTWNRLSLLLTQGQLNSNDKTRFLLSAGADSFAMDIGCFVRIRGQQYEIHESTNPQWKNRVFNVSDSLCKFIINYQDALGAHDLNADSWEVHSIKAPFQFGSYIGAPLFIDDNLYGTIFFASKDNREKEFTQRDIAYLKMLSSSFLSIIKQSATHV